MATACESENVRIKALEFAIETKKIGAPFAKPGEIIKAAEAYAEFISPADRPNGYIIALASNGEIETKAYYASSHAEAIEQREKLVGETALDWHVYARAD